MVFRNAYGSISRLTRVRYMSLIHACELNHANPFDYLTELQKHAGELAQHPPAWMPSDYSQTLQQPPE